MVRPNPSGTGIAPVADRPPTPPSVLNAVKLMYAGAVVSGIDSVIPFFTIGGWKSAIHKKYPHYTAAHVHAIVVANITALVISLLIAVGLWVLMAWLNQSGRNWARIVASVLFALNTLQLYELVTHPADVLSRGFGAAIWLIGLGAIVFLWRRESSSFFQPA